MLNLVQKYKYAYHDVDAKKPNSNYSKKSNNNLIHKNKPPRFIT